MMDIVAPRRRGESDDGYRDRVKAAREKRGIAQLPLPLGTTVDIPQKTADDSTHVEVTDPKYVQQATYFNNLVLVMAHVAMHEANANGYYVDNGTIRARLEDGTTPTITFKVLLDTE
jgi:hypothetical protein